MRKRMIRKILLFLVVTGVFFPLTLCAETTQCTVIDSVPYVITQQGLYCLKGDVVSFDTTQHGIEILANNVTIDFNGFKLGGLALPITTQAAGVYSSGFRNITLKNGNIRGFRRGVEIYGEGGHLITNTHFDGNYRNGVFAMNIGGPMTIEGNSFVNTGGTLVATQPASIYLQSVHSVRILNNDISDYWSAVSGYSAVAIYCSAMDNALIENNVIMANRSSVGGQSGIILQNAEATIVGNSIFKNGIGVFVKDASVGYLKDNTAIDIATIGYSINSSVFSPEIVDLGGNYTNK